MELESRRLSEDDLQAVTRLEAESHPTPWSEGMFRAEMRQGISYFRIFVERETGLLAGYGGFWNMVGDGNITNVTVATEFRRRGIGRQIVLHLLSAMRQAGMEYASLEVRKSNQGAIQLYRACGFDLLGERPGYYSDGETALIFGQRL